MLDMKGIHKIGIIIFCIVITVILIWIYYIHQIRNIRSIVKMFSNDSVFTELFPKKHLFVELFPKKFLEMALLGLTLDLICAEYKKLEPVWHDTYWDKTSKDYIINEANQTSDFDPTNVRRAMIQNIESSTVRTCPYGTVHVIHNGDIKENDIPWGLWGRILRLYREKGKPYTVFFLASPHLREFPQHGNITPYNINGGYTYPCNHDTIVLYRAEDATRVLIHELQHSACLDNHVLGVDRTEAETEAWAELLYCALLSRGNKTRFHTLVKEQSAWILSQNKRVRQFIGNSRAFPWRYTVGKEEVWRRWNILKVTPTFYTNSLRLTMPPSQAIKKQFGVSTESMIL